MRSSRASFRIHALVFVSASALAVTAACKGSGGSGGAGTTGNATVGAGCTPGTIHCQCNMDGTCEGKLVCMSNNCMPTLNCGNGVLDQGEQCDNGAMNCDTCACKSDCTNQVCGDGKVGPGEACDNGMNQLTQHGLGCFKCTNVKQLAVSNDGQHVCALISTGAVKCWGSNTSGQLGLGDTMNRGDKPMQLADALPAVNLGTGRTAIEIAAGGAHTCAILDDHSLKCWGSNANGELGLGDSHARGAVASDMGDALPKIDLGAGRTAVHVAAGASNTCAILDDGSVKCWGSNLGQLGLGDTQPRGAMPGQMGDALPKVDLGTGRTAVAIALGSEAASGSVPHACAILDDGSVKCWGGNSSGELGQGSTSTIGDMPGQMGDALKPVTLFTGHKTTHLATGAGFVCARSDDGHLKCWGANASGQLGQGSSSPIGKAAGDMAALMPINLGTGRIAQNISAMNAAACAVLDDQTMKCWGANGTGQLGQGDTATRGVSAGQMGDALLPINLGTKRKGKIAVAGGQTSCAILDNGAEKCWGANTSGELGQGDTTPRGGMPTDMGDNLSAIPIP